MMNPMQMFNNPLMQRAMDMIKGKNEEEIKQIVINLAQQRGIDMNQLQAMANQFGLKL